MASSTALVSTKTYVTPQQNANANGSVSQSGAPSYGGLSWQAISTPQGATEWGTAEPGGGFYVTGPDMHLYHEPTLEQGGLDVPGFPEPHGGGGFLISSNVASFFNPAPPTSPVSTPPKTSEPPANPPGNGGSAPPTNTTTSTGAGSSVTAPSAVDPYTQALLDLIGASGQGQSAGTNYIPVAAGGTVPGSSLPAITTTTSSNSSTIWIIVAILAIIGGGGWWVYHKYLKKDKEAL